MFPSKVRTPERRAKDKEYYLANRERIRAYQKAWTAKQPPEKINTWRKNNPSRFSEARRRRAGLPDPTRPCPGACEICGRLPSVRALSLDHCHKTGKFRGWLCGNCNTAIGKLGDTVEGLQAAIAYLVRYG